MSSHTARLSVVGALVVAIGAPAFAQPDKVSLSTVPRPGVTVRYRMTQQLAVDVTPEATGDVSFPSATMTGKSIIAATFAAGEADEQGQYTVRVTYDEFTAELIVNGRPTPAASDQLAGKTFELTYAADGTIVDVKGPAGTRTSMDGMKHAVEQLAGQFAGVRIALGETVTLPIDMPLPIPISQAGGLGLSGETTITLVSLESDGVGRIASCDNAVRVTMKREIQHPAERAGDVGIDVKMSGKGTTKIDVDRHVLRNNDATIAIDGVISLPIRGDATPSRLVLRGSITFAMGEIR